MLRFMLFKNYHEIVLNGQTPLLQEKRKDILDLLTSAVHAVDPYLVVSHLFQGTNLTFASESFDLSSFDNIYLVGFGKASIGMAQAVCDSISVTKGVVITHDPSLLLSHHGIEVVVGGHPLPTEGSVRGAERVLQLLQECSENDCVLILISGGGSSLFCSSRVPLNDLQKTTDLLLRSGMRIEEINTIRKHLSNVMGGQLTKYTNGVIISLIISDVINDPISSIASGPTSPDSSSFSDAEEILKRYNLWEEIPTTVQTTIQDGVAGRISENPKEDDPKFHSVFNFVVANNERACQAALKKAQELGYHTKVITTSLNGEASMIGSNLLKKILQCKSSKKIAYITGGEPTVTIQGDGPGGRNQELVLGCLEELAGTDFVIASFATDGKDGNSPVAGAIADGFSLSRAKKHNLSIPDFASQNNSYEFFKRLDDVLVTGPTGTNVMDIQIML